NFWYRKTSAAAPIAARAVTRAQRLLAAEKKRRILAIIAVAASPLPRQNRIVRLIGRAGRGPWLEGGRYGGSGPGLELPGAAVLGLSSRPLLGFLESVGLAVELNDLGMVDESIDECDHAGGAGEHFVPLGEGFVGGDQDRLATIASGDDFKEQVGVPVVVGKVPELVDRQERG